MYPHPLKGWCACFTITCLFIMLVVGLLVIFLNMMLR